MNYEIVIGLEVHCQLSTKSKIFASDKNKFGSDPNTNIGVITLAHPGVLPKLNKEAVQFAIKMGLACQSTISHYTYFDRKNYFYPDLPKGYQTSQDKFPICVGGEIPVRWKEGRNLIEKNVQIHFDVLDASDFVSQKEEFDVIGLFYAHFPVELRKKFHKEVIKSLKKGGMVVLEAFHPLQLNHAHHHRCL